MNLELVAASIAVVFAFDFFNGFHDAANAIATIVATKVLTPLKAVSLAALGNFIGMFFLTGAVAVTIATGIIDPTVFVQHPPPLSDAEVVYSLAILMSGVFGAIVWDIITFVWGLPTSSSHALIGGLIGSALVAGGTSAIIAPVPGATLVFLAVSGTAFGAGAIGMVVVDLRRRRRPTAGRVILAGAFAALVPAALLGRSLRGVVQVVVFMVIAPLIGLAFAFGFAVLVMHLARRQTPTRVNHEFKRLQLLSSGFYSVTHGTNDAQKGMGLITLILFIASVLPPWGPDPGRFNVPLWVVVGAHASISLGTLFGGWRIVRTMSQRVTKLRPFEGFAAESAGGLALAGTALAGIPVSTTHVISSAIMGVGATRRLSAVRWGVARRILWAWIVTIPATALLAAATYAFVRFFL